MPAITDVTVGTGWTPVSTVGSAPPTLWNAANEAILVRFGGAGDEHSIAVGLGLELLQAGMQTEAKCASGDKNLQVLRGIAIV